jgi:hypothetical protein
VSANCSLRAPKQLGLHPDSARSYTTVQALVYDLESRHEGVGAIQ